MTGIFSPDRNPAYGDWTSLPTSLWKSAQGLNGRLFAETCPEIGVTGDTVRLPFLGETLRIRLGVREMTWEETGRSPTFQEGLATLTFLANFKPIALSEKWITPAELPGGRTFFSPRSHPPKVGAILDCWENRHAEFIDTVKRLKGCFIPAGDEGVDLPCLPLVPLRYIFYKGEPVLPPAATVLVNATVHLFFPPDVLWALINLTDERFEKRKRSSLCLRSQE